MGQSKVLLDRKLIFSDGKFVMIIKVLRVERSQKFPEGIKAKYVLIDSLKKCPVLLVDNHEPFGFHIHTDLPKDKSIRKLLSTNDDYYALEIFKHRSMEVINEYK